MRNISLSILIVFLISSCSLRTAPTDPQNQTGELQNSPVAAPTLTISPIPSQVLTICLGSEPQSLFLYGDSSTAARNIWEAIYDGPVDVSNFEKSGVILEQLPSGVNAGVFFEPLQVLAGNFIVDADGNMTSLDEGVVYLPSGCSSKACALIYSGQDPIQVDQLVVRFRLQPGILWSDGEPLTAADSQYSYEVAASLFPGARSEVVAHTQSYTALDSETVEWRGLPGYRMSDYASIYFSPLPHHVWGDISAQELSNAEMSSRRPIGWGAYKIEEWVPGDRITLSKNSNYFRSSEGLPYFDELVFRFVSDTSQALELLKVGECDFLDEMAAGGVQIAGLLDIQNSGETSVHFIPGTAWEHADFGISSTDASLPPIFKLKGTRQALAMCINRQRMVDELFFGQSEVVDSYVHPSHPLYNPDVKHYDFDPAAASALLESLGWLDGDGDPNSPRLSLGVPEVPDGTPLTFTFITTDEDEKMRAAEILKGSLSECGVQVEVKPVPSEVLFAPGPDGPVFGRKFSLAQFNWETDLQPPCYLYLTSEIPGSYPGHPKGWGGANASGFISPEFDTACNLALSSLVDSPEHRDAHYLAQGIFSEELPVVPLYLRPNWVVTRSDLCGVQVDASIRSSLWNIEAFDYGEGCGE
jgi:peptide/nickel transport system substrate-binding protein